MNYFELYPGDYLRDTAELTLAEHGAFLLLLSAYYATERAIPSDNPTLFRLVRAMTIDEQNAVTRVSELFFPISAVDGLRHNKRADEEIVKARARIDAARFNGGKGGRPKKPSNNPVGSNPLTQQEPNGVPSTKALHTPCPIEEREIDKREGSPAGDACKAMREAGCDRVNPSHPELLAALTEGVTPKQLADAVAESIVRGIASPFAYAIKASRSLHAAGASPTPQARASPKAATLGKTAQAIQALEDMKHGNRLGIGRDFDGHAEAHPVIAGKHAGS